MDPLSLLWLFFILASLQPAAERYLLEARRRSNLASLSRKRGATVITLIHRQETMSFFGFPVVRFIDIDDAEGVLRAIRATPRGHPIELILPRGRMPAVEYAPGSRPRQTGPAETPNRRPPRAVS